MSFPIFIEHFKDTCLSPYKDLVKFLFIGNFNNIDIPVLINNPDKTEGDSQPKTILVIMNSQYLEDFMVKTYNFEQFISTTNHQKYPQANYKKECPLTKLDVPFAKQSNSSCIYSVRIINSSWSAHHIVQTALAYNYQPNNLLRIVFNITRSVYGNFNDLKLHPNINAASIVALAESNLKASDPNSS
jgi:hypothetical protein